MSPSENCPDCAGTGLVYKTVIYEEDVDKIVPCHCTKEHDGDGPDD